MKETSNAVYAKPVLTRHGSVAQLTHGGSNGTALDADFSQGALEDNLTFS